MVEPVTGRSKVNRLIQDTLLKYRLRSELSQFRQLLDQVTPPKDDSMLFFADSVRKLIDSREQLLEIMRQSSTSSHPASQDTHQSGL